MAKQGDTLYKPQQQLKSKLNEDLEFYTQTYSDSSSEPLNLADIDARKVHNREVDTASTELHQSHSKRPGTPQKDKQLNELYSRVHTDSFNEYCSLQDLSSHKNTSDDTKPKAKGLKLWKQNLEPKASWYLLFFGMLPVNILIGVDFISFGLYYVEYANYFQVSRSSIGIIVFIKTGVVSFFGIFTSTFIKEYKHSRVCMCGGALYMISSLASSFAPNIYVLYVTQGAMVGVAVSLCTLPTTVLIQQHFSQNRALGAGLGFLGYSIGHFIGPQLVSFLIRRYGWRGSLLITSALMANIIAFGSTYWQPKSLTKPIKKPDPSLNSSIEYDQDQPEHGPEGVETTEDCMDVKLNSTASNQEKPKKSVRCKTIFKDVFDFQLFKEPYFCMIAIAGMTGRYNTGTFIQHLPSKAEHLGMSLQDGALLVSMFSISGIIFRIMTTLVSNLKGVNRVLYYGMGQLIGGAACFCTFIHSFNGLAISSTVLGIHTACTNTIQVVVLVDLLGVERLPKAVALFFMCLGACGMFAAPLGGYIYDATSNYDLPYLVSGIAVILGGILCLVLAVLRHRDMKRTDRASDANTATSEEEHINVCSDLQIKIDCLEEAKNKNGTVISVVKSGVSNDQDDNDVEKINEN